MKTNEKSKNVVLPLAGAIESAGTPAIVDRAIFQTELDALRVREKAHTREGDAIWRRWTTATGCST